MVQHARATSGTVSGPLAGPPRSSYAALADPRILDFADPKPLAASLDTRLKNRRLPQRGGATERRRRRCRLREPNGGSDKRLVLKTSLRRAQWAWLFCAELLACSGRAETAPSDAGQSSAGSSGDAAACIDSSSPNVPCHQSSECCSNLCFFPSLATKGLCVACAGVGEACGVGVNCCGGCGSRRTCDPGAQDSLCRTDQDCASGFCFLPTSNCLPMRCDPRVHPEVKDPRTCDQ